MKIGLNNKQYALNFFLYRASNSFNQILDSLAQKYIDYLLQQVSNLFFIDFHT